MVFRYKVGDRFKGITTGIIFTIRKVQPNRLCPEPHYILHGDGRYYSYTFYERELDENFTKLDTDTTDYSQDALRYITAIRGEFKTDCNHEPHEVHLFTSTVTECKKCGINLSDPEREQLGKK